MDQPTQELHLGRLRFTAPVAREVIYQADGLARDRVTRRAGSDQRPASGYMIDDR
jgi:hypothetical protein